MTSPSAAPLTPPKTCNRHVDCDAADARALAAYRANRALPYREWNAALHPSAEHCHDDCCEDCFGS